MPTTIDSAGITFNDATSLTSAVLAANSVGATQITNGSVTAAKLGTTEQKQICKAWVNFNGTTSPGTIRSQYNVSSVTKNGTGFYTVNFATPMADVNFSAVSSLTNDNVSARFSYEIGTFGQYRTTSAVRIGTVNGSTTSAVDPDGVFVQVFGN